MEKIVLHQNRPTPEIAMYFSAHNLKVVQLSESDLLRNLADKSVRLYIVEKDVAFKIRCLYKSAPILVLTTETLSSMDAESLWALQIEDLVFRPFNMLDLLSRTKNVLRRFKKEVIPEASQYVIGRFLFDTKKGQLNLDDSFIKLTHKELQLLKLLCAAEGQTVQKKDMLKAIWGENTYFNARSMDVYMSRLRSYFKADPSIKISNNRGAGYRLEIL